MRSSTAELFSVHGSAPDIEGKNIANPIASIRYVYSRLAPMILRKLTSTGRLRSCFNPSASQRPLPGSTQLSMPSSSRANSVRPISEENHLPPKSPMLSSSFYRYSYNANACAGPQESAHERQVLMLRAVPLGLVLVLLGQAI